MQSFHAALQARLKHNMKFKSSAYTVSAVRLPIGFSLPGFNPLHCGLYIYSCLPSVCINLKKCQFTFWGVVFGLVLDFVVFFLYISHRKGKQCQSSRAQTFISATHVFLDWD